jgi:hypothetical protein
MKIGESRLLEISGCQPSLPLTQDGSSWLQESGPDQGRVPPCSSGTVRWRFTLIGPNSANLDLPGTPHAIRLVRGAAAPEACM